MFDLKYITRSALYLFVVVDGEISIPVTLCCGLDTSSWFFSKPEQKMDAGYFLFFITTCYFTIYIQ